ncbi:hypothetical protein I7I51_07227 [Histoplasma capsulatum]|uniref:Uncharacterized protein n=1 Tax=Ajellomyces capsulatus TaxID=5037 RepID=A0A8A1MMG5_AJECA|nr:hypothetical protein I7I51_07227 [Histoplasma capsulatum]
MPLVEILKCDVHELKPEHISALPSGPRRDKYGPPTRRNTLCKPNMFGQRKVTAELVRHSIGSAAIPDVAGVRHQTSLLQEPGNDINWCLRSIMTPNQPWHPACDHSFWE